MNNYQSVFCSASRSWELVEWIDRKPKKQEEEKENFNPANVCHLEPLKINCAQFDMSLIKLNLRWVSAEFAAPLFGREVKNSFFNLKTVHFIPKFVFITFSPLLSLHSQSQSDFKCISVQTFAFFIRNGFFVRISMALMKESPVARFQLKRAFIKLEKWAKMSSFITDKSSTKGWQGFVRMWWGGGYGWRAFWVRWRVSCNLRHDSKIICNSTSSANNAASPQKHFVSAKAEHHALKPNALSSIAFNPTSVRPRCSFIGENVFLCRAWVCANLT